MDDLPTQAFSEDKIPKVVFAEQTPFQGKPTRLVSLNFKVPLPVRQQFKIYAARQEMTMTGLLLYLLEDCFRSDAVNVGSHQPGSASTAITISIDQAVPDAITVERDQRRLFK